MLALLVTAGFLAAPAPAQACSCATMDLRTLVDRADRIFVGTVVAIGGPERTELLPMAPHTIDVSSRITGDAAPREVVLAPQGEASCGIEAGVGRRLVLFVRDTSTGPRTGLCDGTRAADADLLDQIQAITGPDRPVLPTNVVPGSAPSTPGSATAAGTPEAGTAGADDGPWAGAVVVLVTSAVALVGVGVLVLRRRAGRWRDGVLP